MKKNKLVVECSKNPVLFDKSYLQYVPYEGDAEVKPIYGKNLLESGKEEDGIDFEYVGDTVEGRRMYITHRGGRGQGKTQKVIKSLKEENYKLKNEYYMAEARRHSAQWKYDELEKRVKEFEKWLLGEKMMFYKGSDGETLMRYNETVNIWKEIMDK